MSHAEHPAMKEKLTAGSGIKITMYSTTSTTTTLQIITARSIVINYTHQKDTSKLHIPFDQLISKVLD